MRLAASRRAAAARGFLRLLGAGGAAALLIAVAGDAQAASCPRPSHQGGCTSPNGAMTIHHPATRPVGGAMTARCRMVEGHRVCH